MQEQGLQDRIVPLRAEAHALPFARASFDAVISVDAYQYFGTDDLYLHYLCNFVKPGGQIGVVVPGLTQPIDGAVPPYLTEPQAHGAPFWEEECVCFHTADWWRAHWGRCGRVEVHVCEAVGISARGLWSPASPAPPRPQRPQRQELSSPPDLQHGVGATRGGAAPGGSVRSGTRGEQGSGGRGVETRSRGGRRRPVGEPSSTSR